MRFIAMAALVGGCYWYAGGYLPAALVGGVAITFIGSIALRYVR